MRKSGFIAAALVAALAFVATGASAQIDRPAGGGGAARAAPAPAAAAPAARSGDAMVGGGGAFRGGISGVPQGGRFGVAPGGGVGSGVNIGPGRGYYPQAGWSQPGPRGYQPGWRGHRHHRQVFGPSIYFGSVYAAQPYYYDDYVYEDYPNVTFGVAASPADVAACRKRFRSYDIRSGTYLSRDGNRYPCP